MLHRRRMLGQLLPFFITFSTKFSLANCYLKLSIYIRTTYTQCAHDMIVIYKFSLSWKAYCTVDFLQKCQCLLIETRYSCISLSQESKKLGQSNLSSDKHTKCSRLEIASTRQSIPTSRGHGQSPSAPLCTTHLLRKKSIHPLLHK